MATSRTPASLLGVPTTNSPPCGEQDEQLIAVGHCRDDLFGLGQRRRPNGDLPLRVPGSSYTAGVRGDQLVGDRRGHDGAEQGIGVDLSRRRAVPC